MTNKDYADLLERSARARRARTRNATDVTETEHDQMLAGMTAAQVAVVKRGIKDYTSDSTGVNSDARAGTINANVAAVDRSLAEFENLGLTNVERVTYRLLSYKPSANVAIP